MTFGERLKSLRKARKLSVHALAHNAEMSAAYISCLENEIQSNPSMQVIIKLADALQTTLSYLCLGSTGLEEGIELKNGIFITFEGVDGAGKTTQAQRLATTLGPDVVLTRELGGTPVSERIRDLFLASDDLTALTELLLVTAARAQHAEKLISPALAEKQIVICDRFIHSTIAYQGYRGGIDLDLIHQLNRVATGGLTPDITFVLDLPPEIGLQRQQHQDRLDKEPLGLHNKIREGYLSAVEEDPIRVKLLDATQSPDAVHNAILTECQNIFPSINL